MDPSLLTQSSPLDYAQANAAGKVDERDVILLMMPEGDATSATYRKKVNDIQARLHQKMRFQMMTRTHKNSVINKDSNMDVFNGNLDETNHLDASAPAGAPGVQIPHDYSFFHTNFTKYEGMIRPGVGKFSVVLRGPKWEELRRQRVAEAGTEAVLREVAAEVKNQTGQDVDDALTDPSTYVPQTDEEWNEDSKLQQELQIEITERLQEAIQLNGADDVLMETLEDGFVFEEDMVHVFVKDGNVAISRLRRDQVTLLGPDDARTEDDLDAVAIRTVITPVACMAKYGPKLKNQKEVDELRDFLTKRVRMPMLEVYKDGTLRQPMVGADGSLIFGRQYANGGIEEQTVYSRMLDMIKVKVMTDIDANGKDIPPRPMKPDEYDQYVEGWWPYRERVIYERLKTDEEVAKAEKKGYPVRRIPIQYMWESVMLDGRYLAYSRMVPFTEREPGRLSTPAFPVVMNFWNVPSLVTRGMSLHELHTNIQLVIRKRTAQLGITAIAYDESQLPEGMTLEQIMYEAGESMILAFNGSQKSGAPTKEGYKHLQPIS
ncbi:MAG: hypothetical protein EON58_10350, partial [Alphaproteobacteria bacterium]